MPAAQRCHVHAVFPRKVSPIFLNKSVKVLLRSSATPRKIYLEIIADKEVLGESPDKGDKE